MGTIVNHGTHLEFMTANRERDTVEVIMDRDGGIFIDVMMAVAKECGRQARIKLDVRQSKELRRFLSTECSRWLESSAGR